MFLLTHLLIPLQAKHINKLVKKIKGDEFGEVLSRNATDYHKLIERQWVDRCV